MKFEQLGNIKLYNADCLELMKTFKESRCISFLDKTEIKENRFLYI